MTSIESGSESPAFLKNAWYVAAWDNEIGHSLTAQYFRFPQDREHLVDGLRKAGFPE